MVMDWITTALNEPAARSTDSSSKEGDDFNKPPNFDQFLNRQQQPGQGQQGQPDQTSNLTNVGFSGNDGKAGSNFISASTAGSSFGNVRIHQTQMQRYLQGLMNSQNNQSSMPMPMNNNDSKVEMLHHLKNLGGGDPNMINKPSLLKGNNSSTTSNNNNNSNPGVGGGLSLMAAPPEKSDKVSSSRQKNDKAVEVHHDHAVIARFRTQTECARYLRATPEAVSYHCSKGGGVCNGLVIKPVDATEVARLLATERFRPGEPNDPSQTTSFGLFEGAVQHRPKERPQLKPETVAILKNWLLSPDHMDNPYPNQRESEMLMEKTGLDKTQLKHWFNNARKRILKPLLKNGGKKPPSPPRKREQIRKRGNSNDSLGGRKKRRGDGGASPMVAAASRFDPSVFGTVDPDDANKISNASYEEHRRRQQQLLMEERQRVRPRQFDDPFMDGGGGNYGDGGNNMMSNMMSMNQYDRLMGFNNGGMNNGMGNMMGYGGMMDNSFNDSFDGGRGGFQGRGNMGGIGGGGGGAFGAGMESDCTGPYDRFGDLPGRTGRGGFQQDRFSQDSHQDGYGGGGDGGSPYCQPLQGPPGGGPGDPSGPSNAAIADDSARSNAVFKQQVATMAMNEASAAFKDMEDAFAHAKGMLAAARAKRAGRPGVGTAEDDPMVAEANARAKKCQSVAMFKLKVSQRASEEAANAYDGYQRMVEEMGGGGGGDGGGGGADRGVMMPMPGNGSPF